MKSPFTQNAEFDWQRFRETVSIFSRMLDNVVEINGLPLPQQQEEIKYKRRHGMGYLGIGSALAMMGMRYGEADAVEFTGQVTKELALEGWKEALNLAKEKGPAPIMTELFEVTGAMLRKRPEMRKDGYCEGDMVDGKTLMIKYSRYMQKITAELPKETVDEMLEVGLRYTHHSSIAPTGTIALSMANNASNGIEPTFGHQYTRNIVRAGKKSKEAVNVYSFELLAYRAMINPSATADQGLPDYFISADQVTTKQHVDMQAAAQEWIDSSISKTANVPTECTFSDFQDVYMYAYEKKLKGCTTFRFNPENFSGVLVREDDLKNTLYEFTLEDGQTVKIPGNEEIEYEGEIHTAANLYDAISDGYYGKL